MARSRSSRTSLIIIGSVLAVALGVAGYAWFDHIQSENSTVAGNVTFAHQQMDGSDKESVKEAVSERGVKLLTNTVDIETPTGEVTYQLSQLGFDFDSRKAEREIFSARHQGGVLDQFFAWASTWFKPIAISDPISFDPSIAMATLEGEPKFRFSSPIEPDIELTDDGFLVATIGSDGLVADLEDLANKISAISPEDETIQVSTRSVAIPPQVSEAESAGAVDAVNEATRGGATIIVNGQTREMTPADLRRHIVASVIDGKLVSTFDVDELQNSIEALYPEPVGGPQIPSFRVEGEEVEVSVPGFPGEICCDPETAGTLAEAILNGAEGPFNVRARPETDEVLTAWYDGSLITSRVSSFTTKHSCCENRVKNIQRMADIVRGYYLIPGKTLSLNAYVGPRTVEKGFLPAGAIRKGRLTPEIGGGVSQFATTIFNAAYFAGLDFLEYQAHSLYFSRYPYGREATISSPAPDLKIKNTTDYPVLIWTSYTGTSITVSMYSTKNIEVEQVATRSSPRDLCDYVETDRERVYSDGRTVIDTYFALYRPEDGLDCRGNQIPE